MTYSLAVHTKKASIKLKTAITDESLGVRKLYPLYYLVLK
jgi:hypothetical protein